MNKLTTSKIIVVMPAYNAYKTLKKTYNDIPKSHIYKVILVDDGSNDGTVLLARKLKIETFVHPQNRGYGGNQKTCYTIALSEGADIVVMIHPDYQYDATLTEEIVRPILLGRADIVLGSRIRSRKEVLAGGMPLYKYISNRFLTTIENIVLGLNLSEYHTGFRAFSKKSLQKLPFHKMSDDFVFDQEILISAAYANMKISEIPVPVRYFPEASSINFVRSFTYGIATLFTLVKYFMKEFGLYNFSIFTR
jgi:glycosyltransferase involved in cell wall biosynthesis